MRRRFTWKQPPSTETLPRASKVSSSRQAEALAPIELVRPLAPAAARDAGTAAPATSSPAPRVYARPSLFEDEPCKRTRDRWSRNGRVAAATLFLLLTGTSLPLPSPDAVARMVASLLATPAETTIERAEVPRPREVARATTSAAAPSRRMVVDLASVASRSMTAMTARFDDAAGSPAAAPVHVSEVPRPVEVHSRPAAVAGIPVPIPVEVTARPVRMARTSMPSSDTEPLPRARGTIVVTTGALLLTSNQLDGASPPFPSLSPPHLAPRPQLPHAVTRYPANGLARTQAAWPSTWPNAWRQARGPQTANATVASVRDLMLVGQ